MYKKCVALNCKVWTIDRQKKSDVERIVTIESA